MPFVSNCWPQIAIALNSNPVLVHSGSARAQANLLSGHIVPAFHKERDLFESNSFTTLLLNCCQQTRCTTVRYQAEQGHE